MAMLEDDSAKPPPRAQVKKSKAKRTMDEPVVGKRDEFIMDTNNSSIVSKRSVEKLCYAHQPEYFRYFVRKFQRRSPLINRGYWLRMKAVEKTVSRFLSQKDGKLKLVVNLGCGYDPLPFQFLSTFPEQCHECVFIDVDYPQLMQRKLEMIKSNQALLDVLPGFTAGDGQSAVVGSCPKYKALGCNLNQVSSLDQALRRLYNLDADNVSLLFVAEVSVAYMERKAADAVLAWAAGLKDAHFCLLEQHLPDGSDHPFAETMLKHFNKLRTPLHTIGTIGQMRSRFVEAGWRTNSVKIRSLWDLWSDMHFLSPAERQSLDQVEPFDEWEEFALFGSHYFLLNAWTGATASAPYNLDSLLTSSDSERPDIAPANRWLSETIETAPSRRRFASAAACAENCLEVQNFGGLGTQERLRTADLFSTSDDTSISLKSDLPLPLMCHTITRIGDELLLVGGRTSPDKPSAACWRTNGKEWIRVQDIPSARFRHSAVQTQREGCRSGVLIYGGKGIRNSLQGDCWLFDTDCGWQTVDIVSNQPPESRFGAAMATDEGRGSSGMLIGGMRADGTVINDCFTWTLLENGGCLQIHFTRVISPTLCGSLPTSAYRLGAQLVSTAQGMVLVGGISGTGMLDRNNEIYNLTTGQAISVDYQVRPLLVGHSALHLGDGAIAILGGGATCFSFGTFWSQSCVVSITQASGFAMPWRTLHRIEKLVPSTSNGTQKNGVIVAKLAKRHKHTTAPRRKLENSADFKNILLRSEPVILEGLDLGACTSKWTTDYLKEKIGPDRTVVIHDSKGPNMDFQSKNFTYQSTTFGKFLEQVENEMPVYLRALSSEKPAESPTAIEKDFPTIAADFRLPSELDYVRENAHSSPLRISGPVTMWLHYDVMANVLCQIRGTKKLRLYAPETVTQLGIAAGASSSSINVWDSLTEQQLSRKGVVGLEAELKEGDVLFIPPLWLHTAQPTGSLSIAVNVFFRDERMQEAYAAGKDVYGNRDVAAYERGRRDVQRIAKSFDGLPQQVRHFYLSRLAQELQSRLD